LGRSTGEGIGYPLQYSAGKVGLIPGSGRRDRLPTPVFYRRGRFDSIGQLLVIVVVQLLSPV